MGSGLTWMNQAKDIGPEGVLYWEIALMSPPAASIRVHSFSFQTTSRPRMVTDSPAAVNVVTKREPCGSV